MFSSGFSEGAALTSSDSNLARVKREESQVMSEEESDLSSIESNDEILYDSETDVESLKGEDGGGEEEDTEEAGFIATARAESEDAEQYDDDREEEEEQADEEEDQDEAVTAHTTIGPEDQVERPTAVSSIHSGWKAASQEDAREQDEVSSMPSGNTHEDADIGRRRLRDNVRRLAIASASHNRVTTMRSVSTLPLPTPRNSPSKAEAKLAKAGSTTQAILSRNKSSITDKKQQTVTVTVKDAA